MHKWGHWYKFRKGTFLYRKYIGREFHFEKGKLWTKKEKKRWTKFVRWVRKVSSLWLLKRKIKFRRQDIFWVKISECTVSNKVHFTACWHAWSHTTEKKAWTGSHFCHPDVKLMRAELSYICHATPRRDWWIDCAVQSDAGECKASDRWGKGLPAVDSLELFAHQSCRETPQFSCSEITDRSRNIHPPSPEVSAYSPLLLPFLILGCRHLLIFCLRWVSWCWPVRTCSLLWVFPPCTVQYWVFLHPVHSQLPQWGHFFRNSLQVNSFGDRKIMHGHPWFATSGEFCPFTTFWVIYTRPALTKMTFTVPMICTLQPPKWLYLVSLFVLYGW